MKRIVISATEASGDRLGAELVDALTRRFTFEAVGLAGPRMREAGVIPLPGSVPMDPVMGFVEVIRHLGQIRKNSTALLRAISEKPDLVVLIDGPDFHLPIGIEARRRGVRTLGYVSPQLWAWRAGRAPKVARAFDLLLCLFAFESALYAAHGLDARWIGHPVVDRVRPSAREQGVVAIFPGSRRAELRRLLRPFLDAVEPLGAREVLLAQALPLPVTVPAWVRVTTPEEALARASLALSKSGTVTLELAQAGIPFVVAHRTSWLTYALGRLFVHGVQHLALPNILAGREVVREYVQDFTPQQLTQSMRCVQAPPEVPLGPPGVAERAADAVVEMIGV